MSTFSDKSSASTSKLDSKAWFDEFVHSIRTDELTLEAGVASSDKVRAYDLLMKNDIDGIMADSYNATAKYHIKKLVLEFLDQLEKRAHFPKKLAMVLSNAKVLVWAQIKEDDEATERALYGAEGFSNAKLADLGFHISITVVEDCDDLPIPNHYQELDLSFV